MQNFSEPTVLSRLQWGEFETFMQLGKQFLNLATCFRNSSQVSQTVFWFVYKFTREKERKERDWGRGGGRGEGEKWVDKEITGLDSCAGPDSGDVLGLWDCSSWSFEVWKIKAAQACLRHPFMPAKFISVPSQGHREASNEQFCQKQVYSQNFLHQNRNVLDRARLSCCS